MAICCERSEYDFCYIHFKKVITEFTTSLRDHYHLEMATENSIPALRKIKLAYDLFLPPPEDEKLLSPIILLHGFIESKKTWLKVAPVISKCTGRKVYAIDLRNHGNSPWTYEFDFNIMAWDVENFMLDHSISRAILIGHSGGARAAMVLALKKPAIVEKLVIEDMTPKKIKVHSHSFMVKLLEFCKKIVEKLPTNISEEEAKKRVMDFLSSPQLRKKYVELEKSVKAYDFDTFPFCRKGDHFSFQANIDAILRLIKSDKMQQDLSGLYMGDALFLYGSTPFYDLANDELIPKLFPSSTLKEITGANHSIHTEHPKAFLQCVINFIKNSPQRLSKY